MRHVRCPCCYHRLSPPQILRPVAVCLHKKLPKKCGELGYIRLVVAATLRIPPHGIQASSAATESSPSQRCGALEERGVDSSCTAVYCIATVGRYAFNIASNAAKSSSIASSAGSCGYGTRHKKRFAPHTAIAMNMRHPFKNKRRGNSFRVPGRVVREEREVVCGV